MRKSAEKLAEAAGAKKAAAVKDAATELNAACNSCHKVFKD
jgi:cytochrome c556